MFESVQVPRTWRPPLESATRAPLGVALPPSREACRADLSSSRFYFQRRTPASRIAISPFAQREKASVHDEAPASVRSLLTPAGCLPVEPL